MAHGDILPFRNFRSFLETKVLQGSFLGLSKTTHLSQHRTVLYYSPSRVRRNGLLLPRKNTSLSSGYSPHPPPQLCPSPPLRSDASCYRSSLSCSCWLYMEHTSHIQPSPTLQAPNSKNCPLLPPACTHLQAEIPSGT